MKMWKSYERRNDIDEPLNTSFDALNSLLGTCLLDETLDSDMLNALLSAESPEKEDKKPKDENDDMAAAKYSENTQIETECSLQIANCYSLANIPSGSVSISTSDVFDDHSYALSCGNSSKSCGVNPVGETTEPQSLVSNASLDIVDSVVLEDVKDVAADSGVDDFHSVYSHTEECSTLYEDEQPRNTVESVETG